MRVVKRSVAATLLLAALSSGAAAFAGTTGGINGTLRDAATNAPIADAKITATSPSQVASVTTDNGGNYSFPNLAPDTYTVSSKKAGYADSSATDVQVTSDQQLTVDLTDSKAAQ